MKKQIHCSNRRSAAALRRKAQKALSRISKGKASPTLSTPEKLLPVPPRGRARPSSRAFRCRQTRSKQNTPTKPIRVLLADDHTIMREGLVLLVNSQHDMRVVAQAADGREACEKARAVKPNVAVIDLSMPGISGLKVAEVLRRDCARTKVLALSMHEDESYLRALVKARAAGYVLKRSAGEVLLQAIRKVAGGGVYFDHALATRAVCDELAKRAASLSNCPATLTDREETVLRLIAWGYTNKEIATRLSLSPKTIEAYKCRFGKKPGLHGRAQIVRYAWSHGWFNDGKVNFPDESAS